MKSKIIWILAVSCLLSAVAASAAAPKKSGKNRTGGPVTQEFGRQERKQKPARAEPATRPSMPSLDELNRSIAVAASAPQSRPQESYYLNPDIDPKDVGLRSGNRAKNPQTKKTEFPIKANTKLYDSRGNFHGVLGGKSVKINYGGIRKIKPTPSARPQKGYSVWYTKLNNGGPASGLVLARNVSVQPRMPELKPKRPPSKGVTAYTITGGERGAQTFAWGYMDKSGNFVPFKVTPGYRGGGRNSTDYGLRSGTYVNLSYNLPGRGGVAFDTFKQGATFYRERYVPSVKVPLYYPGGTKQIGSLTFLYGRVQTPTGLRRGGMPLEALTRRL